MSNDSIFQDTTSPEEFGSSHNLPKEEVPSSKKQNKKENPSIKNLLLFSFIVMVIVLPIRLYIAKPFIVSGTSMFPTFNTWNYLLIDQLTYRFYPPKRGDVVVFRYPRNPSRFFIKRIIGLPNETVKLSDTNVTIFNSKHKKGFTLKEPYVAPENSQKTTMSVTLKGNQYFVMGDNRRVSYDSRYWGPLNYDKMIGRVYVRLFPFNEVSKLPGSATYSITNSSVSK